ncbi:MAG: [citrate (pro-3S)-lyase] ligase [Enterobacteriaceae bacterium]|jgi:[citrate (pro-3S)-lyase] ligase|nr:[citrate (pro-3S)-lyase] ligase [Enterobacteriaceae bacterium]
MSGEYQFNWLRHASSFALKEIEHLLASNGLALEKGLTQFVEVRDSGRLIACAGLDGNIIKCVAINELYRGSSLSLSLISEVMNTACREGIDHLFLYTKPENVPLFVGCGFTPLVSVAGRVTLLENSATRLKMYCSDLAKQYHQGQKIGGIVMNANPFTLGHYYLIKQAAACCDWLHVFVVKEDASRFAYKDRFELVRAGIADIDRVILHAGSDYILSKATFPAYFLKDQGIVDECYTALDLMLFRQYIAPALGINHRFVGTEPFDAVTAKYNRDMAYWLSDAQSDAPPITVVEIPRIEKFDAAISASRVRKLLDEGNWALIRELVPETTFNFLLNTAKNNVMN